MPQLSPDANAYRDWLLSFVPVQNGTSIVDLGCGAGHDLIALARKNPHVSARLIGLDASEKSIASALAQPPDEPRLSFVSYDLEHRLPFEPATVDAVFTNNVLECLAEPVDCAREIGRIVQPGGTVVTAH